MFLKILSTFLRDTTHTLSISFFFFNFYFYFILLYSTVLVLPCIDMNPHGCTRIPKHEPPSHLPPHNISLGHPCAPAPSMLYPASDIDWRFDSYMIVYMLQCHSPKSSHPLPLPLSPKVRYTQLSFFLSCIQGRHCHLSKFPIYVLVYCIGVFLSGLLHSV